MISHPEKNDIEQMKTVWELCFKDDRETVDVFYDICFSPDECYISKSGETVQAVLQMIECSLVCNNAPLDTRYMYAVCTHPDFQGRGIMTSLIREALESEKKKGTKAVLCIPANESLFSFYKRFGFENGIYCSETEFDRNYIVNNSVECLYQFNPSGSCFNKERNRVLNKFSTDNYVLFPEKYISLANVFLYSTVFTDNSYAVYSQENGCIRITDACFNEDGFKELCYVLKNETNEEKYVFDFSGTDNGVLKGLVKVLDDNIILNGKTYLGIKME